MHDKLQQYRPYICTSLARLVQSLDPHLLSDPKEDEDILLQQVLVPPTTPIAATITTNRPGSDDDKISCFMQAT